MNSSSWDQTLTAQQPSRADTWVDLLHVACATLLRASRDEIETISVTCRLEGAPGEARRLLVLSKRLAEVYGLQALASVEGFSLTVRFSRDKPGSAVAPWSIGRDDGRA